MKWLTAVIVSKENIMKFWDCKISDSVTDVTVPNNTVFYFFSTRKADLKISQLKFLDTAIDVWVDEELHALALDHKLYCCGKKENSALIVTTPTKKLFGKIFSTFEKISILSLLIKSSSKQLPKSTTFRQFLLFYTC